MNRIILDTNFLMIPYYFKVDIFSEIERICHFKYELYIIGKTMEELQSIVEKQSGKEKDAAKFAINMVKQKSLKRMAETHNSGAVDDIILSLDKSGLIVATQDKDLKKRLRQQGVPVIILRQKKYLQIVGVENVL